MIRRRKFITLVGGAAVAWPLAARAQQPAMQAGLITTPQQAKAALLRGPAVDEEGNPIIPDPGFADRLRQGMGVPGLTPNAAPGAGGRPGGAGGGNPRGGAR